MEISMNKIVGFGVHYPVAAAITEGCERIKNFPKCWQVTIPTLIQQGSLLLQDKSNILRKGVSDFTTDKQLNRGVQHYLWQQGVQLHVWSHHTITLYNKSFEEEFMSSQNCFEIKLKKNACRLVSTTVFLDAIVNHPKCRVHGFVSASAVAHGIRNAFG